MTNAGYAAILDARITLHEPESYDWISVLNGELGRLEPRQANEVQIYIDPAADAPLGTHVVQLDLLYDGTLLPVYLTVEITTASFGQVAVKVYDDTGEVVPNAEVNLISKAFFVNSTPQGEQEYNNVIRGSTNADGELLLSELPAQDYRYLISASGHDPREGEITVEVGTVPQELQAILVTNLVNVEFSVTETGIQDQYDVTLNITYATDLTKPTLYAQPSSVYLSFFPEERYEGTLTITNTSNNAPVRDIVMKATGLDPVDNELEISFAGGAQTLDLGRLEPKQSIQIPFNARIPDADNAILNSRRLGNILVSGNYTFSIQGEARESTTTPIPVIYQRPSELRLPSISYVNDETDGDLLDLEYKGTSYRLSVRSNRDMEFAQESDLKGIDHIFGGPDAASLIEQNSALWWGKFNRTAPLTFKGDQITFDIDGLEEALEAHLAEAVDRKRFLKRRRSIGFYGAWSDRSETDAYLIPISITTKRDNEIVSSHTSSGSGCGYIDQSVPTLPMEHGEVKIQIKQKVGLEREAFDALLKLTPTVDTLENTSVQLMITDEQGNDAGDLFFLVVTQQTGIGSLEGSTVSGLAEINWQIIPSSLAGGTTPEGLNYTVSAVVAYDYQGNSYSYDTLAETITVLPMPKLTLDYYAPWVVMAGKPAKSRVTASNTGAGAANDLVLSSAQPKIVENENNIPINFTITGSSPVPDEMGFQGGTTTIAFSEVAAGSAVSGYWGLKTSRHGYFVEFGSTLKHLTYQGIELDPLIEEVNTHL